MFVALGAPLPLPLPLPEGALPLPAGDLAFLDPFLVLLLLGAFAAGAFALFEDAFLAFLLALSDATWLRLLPR